MSGYFLGGNNDFHLTALGCFHVSSLNARYSYPAADCSFIFTDIGVFGKSYISQNV